MGVIKKTLQRIIKPLRSRKVRTAIVTVMAAYLAESGLEVSTEMLLTILGVGIAVITGIAIEDNGKHRKTVELVPGKNVHN